MIPGFIDTHCHFDFSPFRDNETASLAQARSARVEKMIVPAVSASGFARVVNLARQHTGLYAALGLHPIAVEQHNDASLATLECWLAQECDDIVAIGEAGLDLYRPEPMFERQCELLVAQLKLAARFNLPMILHSRRTHDPMAMLLRRYPVPRTGVIHGFSGSLQQAKRFIDLGYGIGVGGTITYPRASKTRRTIATLPLAFLVLETDAPDMPINGFQGQPNRPEQISKIFNSLCELRPESRSG